MRLYYNIAVKTILFLLLLNPEAFAQRSTLSSYPSISGIYPHLAYYNDEGECGTGAVVPWAGRLWVITYGPHLPYGSSDKLYEITPDFQQITRPESVGGTPANRLIHQESQQLFIGPYAIDTNRQVRVISYDQAPGRYTGTARHLTQPEDIVYMGTMEEGFYEVNVNTLATKLLYKDGNIKRSEKRDVSDDLLSGAHGKGLYSGQGVVVYSNNGEAVPEARIQFDIESGVLAEWNGKEWKEVRRNQFVEVTGPGGIYGNANPATDPIWVTGWDYKSVLLGIRDAERGWSFFRLPKASHSYDGAHGWNTEWPRIRDIGTVDESDYLMTMHGMFWQVPTTLAVNQTAGIRPRSAYLKVIGDFTRWNNQLVFGCDDSAQKEFLNKRSVKGGIEGPGQSNSNLWFTDLDVPDKLGPTTAEGAVWLDEGVLANTPSEPFLLAGWSQRAAWFHNTGEQSVVFSLEVDPTGQGDWQFLQEVSVKSKGSQLVELAFDTLGEWIRVVSDKPTRATAHFFYTDDDKRSTQSDAMFAGLATADQSEAIGGLLYGLGDNRRSLGISVTHFDGADTQNEGYYELDSALQLQPKDDQATQEFINEKFTVPKQVVTIESSSVLIVDDQGRRWRLPLGSEAFTSLTNQAALRIDREVATERDLMNCHGTFYELPAENADGFAKIRPISSHNYRIHDYASYRGLLVMIGIDPNTKLQNEHVIISEDKKAAVWVGVIDDLWKLGKPIGRGGPWKDTSVSAGEPSDPYLIGFYDQRSLELSHQYNQPVTFTIEVEPVGHGPWMVYQEVAIAPGETFEYNFPAHFQSRWIRFRSNTDCKATAWLEYK